MHAVQRHCGLLAAALHRYRANVAVLRGQQDRAYIYWYNEKRIKIPLGCLSPLEYRESLGLIT